MYPLEAICNVVQIIFTTDSCLLKDFQHRNDSNCCRWNTAGIRTRSLCIEKKKKYSQESTGWWSTLALSNQQKKKVPNSLFFFLVFAKPDMYPLPLFLPASLFHREKKIGRKVGKEMADICTLIYKRHIQHFSWKSSPEQ